MGWRSSARPCSRTTGCRSILYDLMTVKDCYVYLVIMYSVHVELAVSPVNAGHLVTNGVAMLYIKLGGPE